MVNVVEYAISMIAQQWRTDPYYVGSSAPKHPITVVAGTKQEGFDEAARALGPASNGYYWRFFAIKMQDARLMPEPTDSEKGAS